jgi:hypothetical protein
LSSLSSSSGSVPGGTQGGEKRGEEGREEGGEGGSVPCHYSYGLSGCGRASLLRVSQSFARVVSALSTLLEASILASDASLQLMLVNALGIVVQVRVCTCIV